MNSHIRERREETWRLYIEMGVPHNEVVARIADRFDEKKTTIKTDISRMPEWLPKMDDGNLYNGASRMREIREARKRQRQYEMMAHREEDYSAASRINDRLIRNVQLEVELSERLGLVDEEPAEMELAKGLEPDDEDLVNQWANVGQPLELDRVDGKGAE